MLLLREIDLVITVNEHIKLIYNSSRHE